MNIVEHIERGAAIHPERAAVLFEGKSVGYGALDLSAGALSRTLLRIGVGPGDRVALYLPNIPAFVLAYLATLRIGAIAVSVNAAFRSEGRS